MAALQERHRWMASNVALAMDMPDRLKYVEDMLSEYNNFKKINDFLEGKSKHRHVFVYYQKASVLSTSID